MIYKGETAHEVNVKLGREVAHTMVDVNRGTRLVFVFEKNHRRILKIGDVLNSKGEVVE